MTRCGARQFFVVASLSPKTGTHFSARCSIHVLAAVDRQSRAGDEAAVFRAEENDATGDLVGAAQTADGNPRDDLLEHVGRHRRDHLGVDVTGRDRVDGDAGPRAFLGQRLGEAVDAGFGGRIIDLPVLAGLTLDRADIAAAAIFARVHSLPDRLGHVEAAAEIDVDHRVPRLAVHPLHRAVAGDAGIVDEDVDRAELAFHLLRAGDAGVEVGDVPFVGLDAIAFAELARFLLVAGIVGGDGDALVAQRDADRFADAAGPAGDDCTACLVPLPGVFGTGLIAAQPNLQARGRSACAASPGPGRCR